MTAQALDAPALPSAPDRDAPPGGVAALRAHLRAPLFRNAYALITSTMLTTGFGMLSWIAAARLYSVEDVGRGQSAVNTLILLGGLGNLRLMNVLTRFLPRARERTAWLVRRCYQLATLTTLVVCAGYLALPDDVAPLGELMGPTPFAGLWLVAGVWSFALFTLQDGVLTGLRSAAWVPVQNGVHSVVKLALVVGLAGVLPAGGIYASWVVPAALLLVPVQLLIARRLVPANAASHLAPEPLSVRRLAPFTAAEYAGALCELAVANLIPLVVAQRLGLAAAGTFGAAWLIGTTLDHVVVHFGSSLTVEGAAEPARLVALTRDLLKRSAAVIVPVAVVVVVGAPLVMRLFGARYAEEAGGLLRLLGLALVPRLFCTVAVVVARVRARPGAVVGIQAALAAGTIAGSFALIGTLGTAAPGLAYLASSCAVALVVAPGLVMDLRDVIGPRHLRGTASEADLPGQRREGRRRAAERPPRHMSGQPSHRRGRAPHVDHLQRKGP